MPKMTFEKALEQLEQIVQDMETGELNLENALKKFEEGMKLSKFCSNKLDEIEQKISVLVEQPDGKIKTTPYEDGAGFDDDNSENG